MVGVVWGWYRYNLRLNHDWNTGLDWNGGHSWCGDNLRHVGDAADEDAAIMTWNVGVKMRSVARV